MQRNAFHVSHLLCSLSAILIIGCAADAQIAPPAWWASRGVINTNSTPNDFAALNIGQLKHLAYTAWLEMNTLPGGAGFVPTFTNAVNNYAVVNVGQLKEAARPFFDRLGLTNHYPWTGTVASNDFAVANIGQAKFLFSFNPHSADFDQDGMPDGWETLYGLDPLDVSDAEGDTDGDGLLNVYEYGMSTNPNLADSDGDGMWDLMEIQYGFDPTVFDGDFPDSDGDGLDDFEELIRGTDPDGADTDHDGLSDYKEIYDNFYHGHAHTNVTVNGVFVFGTDPTVPDCDDDGLNDGDELKYGTDPWDKDTDDDGIDDGKEVNDYYMVRWNSDVTKDRISFCTNTYYSLLTSPRVTNAVALSAWQVGDSALCLLQDGGAGIQYGNEYYFPCSFVTNAVSGDMGNQNCSVILKSGDIMNWHYYEKTMTLAGVHHFESPVTDVACGWGHSVALLSNGTVRTFGPGYFLYAGWDDTYNNVTNQPAGLTNVIAVAAGSSHSLALLATGKVACWGSSSQTNVPSQVSNAVAVAAGQTFSAALLQNGTVVVWGSGGSGLSNGASKVSGATMISCGDDICVTYNTNATVSVWNTSQNSFTNYSVASYGMVRAVRGGGNTAAACVFDSGLVRFFSPRGSGLQQRELRYLRVKDCLPLSSSYSCALLGTNPQDPDSDGDGLPDGWELRFALNPLSPCETNALIGLSDPDGDGLSNLKEFEYGSKPTSADGDGDGLDDAEEHAAGTDAFNPDSDGDGLNDGDEVHLYGSSPTALDTDGDGLPDRDEILRYGTSPALADSDGDGLPDDEEILIQGTDPLARDTDGDGLPDFWEVENGRDPLVPDDWATVDTDSDGMPDFWELAFFGSTVPDADDDEDDDGVSNLDEYLTGTDPVNSLSFVFGLPPAWRTLDLGTPERLGGASHTNGTFTVTGGYCDLPSPDSGRICFLPVWGNFIFTARVVGVGEGGVGGIMIRKSSAPDAVKIELRTDAAGQVSSLVRKDPASANSVSNHAVSGEVWLRLQRSGSPPSFAGSAYTLWFSTNGTSWSYPRTVDNIDAMGTETLVGLFARSGQPGELCSAIFTNVSFTHSGFAPFSLESDTGPLFAGTNIITVQPLTTGLTFTVSTTNNLDAAWFSPKLIRGTEPFSVTSTAPAFVRVKAERSGSFTPTYASRFVTDRHLSGWLAYYNPLAENAWPASPESNAAWVSHIPSEDCDTGGGVAGGFWTDRVSVRLKTTLAVPYTLNDYWGDERVFKVEYIGAVKAELVRGTLTNKLFDCAEAVTWTTRVFTNTSIFSGLSTLNVDLKSWSGPAGVRLWWRTRYEPVFRRILPTDCFVADANRNGTADGTKEWFDASELLSPDPDADSDEDGFSDADETAVFRTNPLDRSSRPLAPIPDLVPTGTVPGLVALGFRDTGAACARFYDQPYAGSVSVHTGAVDIASAPAFAPLIPATNSAVCGLAFEGFFVAEEDGWYEFSLSADDRAVFELGGVRLASVAAPGTRTGGIYLLAGCHPLRLVYENRNGSRSLALSYRRNAAAFALVPGRLLRSLPESLAIAQNLLDADGDGIPATIDADDTEPDTGADSDGDGVSDREEREWTQTDPFTADITTNAAWQTEIPGEIGLAASGEWFADGGGLYCASRNGTSAFPFTAASNGFYRIDLYVREFSEYAVQPPLPFLIELALDGASCGLREVPGPEGSARFYTPFLTAGTHTATVRWINTLERHSLLVERLVVSLPDGTADWARTRLSNLLAVSAPPESHTSPVCIEGTEAGCMDAAVLGGFPAPENKPSWTPEKKRLPGNAWCADVPLSSNGVTHITACFEGAPAVSTCSVEWVALNVAACREVTVRQGDTLKFSLSPIGESPVMLSAGANTITFTAGASEQEHETNTVAVVPSDTPAFLTFGAPGTYSIRAMWSEGAKTYALETRVNVIGVAFSRDPFLHVGQWSDWAVQGLSPDLWFEADSHLALEWVRDSVLRAKLLEDRVAYASVRLFEDGPVLAAARADTFFFTSHNEAGYMRYLYAMADGTRVFEGRVSVERLTPDLTLTIRFLSSLNYFENGLQSMTFTAGDFDQNGELVFTMFVTGSSFCHVQTFSQGGTVITTY